MNGLSIVVAAIFLVCALWGYKRGFIKIVASLAATLATIILVTFLTPYISSVVLKVFPIEKAMQEKCIEMLMPEETKMLPEGIDSSRETQISLLENAKIPEMFRQLLLENNNDEIYKSLGVTTFTEYVSGYLAKLAANIISFLVTLLVATVIVRVVIYTLGIIGDLPMIGGLNRVAGGLVGLGTGLVVIWVLFIVITLMYETKLGTVCFQHIAENEFLAGLYDHNILMNFITKFRA